MSPLFVLILVTEMFDVPSISPFVTFWCFSLVYFSTILFLGNLEEI